ncbi:hypothetical protein L195_g017104, partial [Trifolium pratense]
HLPPSKTRCKLKGGGARSGVWPSAPPRFQFPGVDALVQRCFRVRSGSFRDYFALMVVVWRCMCFFWHGGFVLGLVPAEALLQGPHLVFVISFSRGAVFCVLGGDVVRRVWRFLGGGGRLRVAGGAVDDCAAGSLVAVGVVMGWWLAHWMRWVEVVDAVCDWPSSIRDYLTAYKSVEICC